MKARATCRRSFALALILLGAGASWAESGSSPPPDYRPPQASGLCPALAEDFEICSDDLWSGNCADFVSAADRLGEVYRSELREHPGWISGPETTHWWDCGSANLGELRSLLLRIDTPKARAVLAQEPYRSLPQEGAPAPRSAPPEEPDCEAPSTPDERNACSARNLSRAKAEHERFFAACKERVAPSLRQELADAEKSWQKLLGLECSGAPTVRDECLARAYAERSQSIRSMHPECEVPGSDERS